ncbi:DNA ligase 4 [Fusarium oxysporum f. sp. cubense race 1]|uniref:DNA ligase 4 n=1 Tax=Fusarium oxysporum f. sp. cubense (strain race 1) TaxID=1229664 RepID=N4U423_FUSC1|nr:DNA ligase 4 [Fusarium oxysporum f. sp. cubense race 1]
MPLPFSLVCELLEQSFLLSLDKKSCSNTVTKWFTRHRNYVDAHDTNLPALLSTLLPEKRTDRVYCIQSASLERIIGRAYLLGLSRIKELAQYRQPGSGVDLADCVFRILTVTLIAYQPSPSYDHKNLVTVEEIDQLLHSLAAKIKWSSPSIRASQASLTPSNRTDLESLYRRLSATEAKWFTRLVLKSYRPLVLDPYLIYRLCDPILPCVVKIQDDFATAITSLQAIRGRLLPNAGRKTPREQIMGTVKPQLGVKIGRQPWVKGRSIKHCLDMGHGRMSVEEKIDGEYCQIHVDPSKGDKCIQIFSKSGKDSTEDRVALHGDPLDRIIQESLKIGQPDTRVKKACILEGELVVYDDSVGIFGHLLSSPGPQEHLMVIYYDVMLLEDQSLINLRHSERFKILSNLVCCRKGWAGLVPRQVIDFGQPLGASTLRKAFAMVILAWKEGLVLKPDEPYFDFTDQRRRFSSCCIKLKKEYIGNFGDVGDFSVVGARYDSTKALSYRIPGLKWTHFYIGCLDNREAVKSWGAKPEFTIVNVVELNETILREVVTYSNPEPVSPDDNGALALKLAPGVEQGSPPTFIFTKPLVFDLKCFSFDRVGNTGFWSLRFPSVTKVHFDREFTDTITFEQLQALAKEATTAGKLEDSQENLQWIAKLEAADPRGIAVDAASQLTVTTMPTPSPRKSTQNTTSTRSPKSPLATKSPLDLPSITATTSLRTEPSSPTKLCAKHKRGLPSTGPTSQHKRLKSSSETSISQKDYPHIDIASQPRAPLAARDNNPRPQPAKSSCAPCCPSYPSESFFDESSNADGVNAEVVKFIINPGTGELQTETNPERLKPSTTKVTTALKRKCVYAGEDCMLANAVVLFLPGLLAMKEAKKLLAQHGVDAPVTDIDTWLKAEKEARQKGKITIPSKAYVVCDSDNKLVFKHLAEKFKELRKDNLFNKGTHIEIHDWRFLSYLTTQEDESIEEKYFHGFSDWRMRWKLHTI